MVKSYVRRQLDHSVVTLFTPKNYTHRFLVVANLGADADYTQEPRYLVEMDLPYRIDGRSGLTNLCRSKSAIRQSGCPFTFGDDYLVWLVDDACAPKLFLNERIAQLRSGKRFFTKKSATAIFNQVQKPHPLQQVELLVQVEADFEVEHISDEELTWDDAYEVTVDELEYAFSDFKITELVDTYYEDGDEEWSARGSGWTSFTQSVQFAVNAEMTSRQIQTLIKQVESNINLDDCEVTEIWLIHEGKPVLDLGLLLDFKDGHISKRKLRSLQKERLDFRSFVAEQTAA